MVMDGMEVLGATSTSTGTVYGPYGLTSGSSGTATFTSSDLEILCHLVTCGGGSWMSEVSGSTRRLRNFYFIRWSSIFRYTRYKYGCTDPNAPNYDPTADIDDGS